MTQNLLSDPCHPWDWFSILVRRLLKRASFSSTEDLRQRLLAFITYFNQHLAKPFKWTYTGKPLTV